MQDMTHARQAFRTLELANQNARGLLRFGRPEQQGAIIEELVAGLEAAQQALAAILSVLDAGHQPEATPPAAARQSPATTTVRERAPTV
jgi:hypothetical protein